VHRRLGALSVPVFQPESNHEAVGWSKSSVQSFIGLTQPSIYHVVLSILVNGFDKKDHCFSWSGTRHFICPMCPIQKLAHSSSAFLQR
jgi:hypothetical protein